MANEHDNSGPKTISSGVGVNVKGAYVEMIASLSFDTIWLFASMQHTPVGFPEFEETANLDLAVGGVGSEVIKIPDWRISLINAGANWGGWGRGYTIQFGRAAGERISCRIADTDGGSKSYRIGMIFFKDQGGSTVP